MPIFTLTRQGMRRFIFATMIATVACGSSFAQTNSFPYQGKLNDGGSPATGNYDFQFTLWDALSGGTQQPQPAPITVALSNVAVSGGVFTVQLDFGASAFPGANRWLEIAVRPVGAVSFTTLSPRQPITSTPYAVRSASAGAADTATTAVNANQLGGVAASSYLQAVTKNSSLTGNGTNVSPLGLSVPLQLSGNLPGNIISGTNSNSAGSGVYGETNDPGDGNGGVTGVAANGDGVVGRGGRAGVFGSSSSGVGVSGNSGSSSFAGVLGFNSSTGYGVQGLADNGTAIYGKSANGLAGYFQGTAYFSNKVGIGAIPSSIKLLVVDDSTPPAVSSGDGTNAVDVLYIKGGDGGDSLSTTANFGGKGGGVLIAAGHGGGSNVGHGGEGGSITLQPGQSGPGPSVPAPPGNLLLAPSYGNVGIGTVNPSAKLHVFGNSIFGGDVWMASSVGMSGHVGVGTLTPVGQLNIVGSAGATQGVQIDNREIKFRGDGIAHFSIFANRVSGALTIEDTSSSFTMNTPGTVALAIAGGSGNVGLGGVTAPTSKLQVNGEGRFSTVNIDSYVSGQNISLCTAGAGGNQNLVGLCSSSLRYKTNVGAYRDGLSVINRLRPISFDWKQSGIHDVGLAAEEVEKVAPLLTFRNDKGEIEGVKYSQLSVVLINAIKEQQAQIDKQQKQIEQLKKIACRSHARARVCR